MNSPPKTHKIYAEFLKPGILIMESPERSLGVINRVILESQCVYVELIGGGSERYDLTADVLVLTERIR